MKVKQLLKSYVSVVQMGESSRPPIQDAGLATGLAAVSHTNQLYFQMCFGALLLLFTGSCVLVVRFINDPGRLGVLFTATGISIAGLITQMVSLWKQKVTADVVALLAGNLQPADVRAVIEILFAKL
jgi:hypothetical protein